MKLNLKLHHGYFYPAREEDAEAIRKESDGTVYEASLTKPGDLLSYRAVFWIWMRSMAKSFTERGRTITPEELHDVICHKFLGYTEERTIGKTTIKPALRTLTYPQELTTDEFYALLRQVEEWASDMGVPLPANPSLYSEERLRNG